MDKIILHNRISESTYNVELAIVDGHYAVTYGRSTETYPLTPYGLACAVDEYRSCVDHAIDCEGR